MDNIVTLSMRQKALPQKTECLERGVIEEHKWNNNIQTNSITKTTMTRKKEFRMQKRLKCSTIYVKANYRGFLIFVKCLDFH